jgi:hypothetical protein
VPDNCPALRGVGLTNGFQSSGFDDQNGTFQYIGIHGLEIGDDLSIEDAYGSGYNATANLGLDTLALQNGAGSEELSSLGDVPTFGLSNWNFFMPSLGLGVGYLQSTTKESPSFMESLANSSLIPSRSWSYTAGASYRDYVGSLVLGGYDDTRIETNTTTHYALPPSTDTSQLQLSLASIAFSFTNGTEASIPISETVIIDSTLPYLYLPSAICDDLATRLGLTYNEPTDLFTISPDALATNRQNIEQIRITVGDTQNSGNTTSISFPYAAFDLNATWPFYDEGVSQPFFPIRRAPGDTYILGRVFLQEAYLSVDWERAYFNLSQVAFPSTRTEANLIPIYNTSITSTNLTNDSSSGGLSTGATAGIAVAAVILGLLVLALLLWFCIFRKRRNSKRKEATELSGDNTPMIHRKESPLPNLGSTTSNLNSPTNTVSTTTDPISAVDGAFMHTRRVSELSTQSAHEERTGMTVFPGIHEVADEPVKRRPGYVGREVRPLDRAEMGDGLAARSEMDGSSGRKVSSSTTGTSPTNTQGSSPASQQHYTPRSELEAEVPGIAR